MMKDWIGVQDVSLKSDNYFNDKAYLSNSMLSLIKRSPLHLHHYLEGKLKKDSPALRYGTAYDMLIFEPALFAKCFTYIPKGIRRGTLKYKEWQEKNNPNYATEVTASEWDSLFRMKDALQKHPEIWEMLSIGERQKILKWSLDGVLCKGKLDN